ncbi:AraC family transcriptional regulator [Amycolatopsis thermoflava]|uniref:AraC family transcriptional regulator n=1 Tax=Amycolatopsis thermoflava TaxID=84480 RepID=UPI0004186E66|nr:helix-turn-helix domain-containing protein [Amycolatopsis thermoflava]
MLTRPLEQYEIFRSHDIDQTRDLMSRVLCEHYLDVLDPTAQLDARMNSTRLSEVLLNYVEYGAPVLVDPGRTRDFFVVQAHLRGSGVVRSGREQIAASSKRIVVSSPEEALRMSLTRDTELVLVKIGTGPVERILRDLLGAEPDRPIRFELGMDVVGGAPRYWYRTLIQEIGSLGKHGQWTASPWSAQFEEWLVTKLLVLQYNNYSERLSRIAAHPAPARLVTRATELVRADPQAEWTSCSVAAALGVEPGRLESGFQRYRGLPVTDFLFRERLRAVYHLLQDGHPGEIRLSDVARCWGFRDQYRFASKYTATFGETPDQTLRR